MVSFKGIYEVILELYFIMGVSYFMYKWLFKVAWSRRAALGLVTSMHQSELCCRDEIDIKTCYNGILLYNEVEF